MNKLLFSFLVALAAPLAARAQGVGLGTGAVVPDASAALEVKSTTQGLLPPRLTAAQRAAIVAPATGLMVYQTDGTAGLYYYNGKGWLNASTGFIPAADGTALTAPNQFVVSTLAGTAGSLAAIDGTGSSARFFNPSAIALDAAGNLFVSDQNNFTIRKVTPAGVVSTFAGTAGSSGSTDGTGAAARFQAPQGLAFDAAGNLYVGEGIANNIRKITPAGVVSTFAGQQGGGAGAYLDGTGTAARFNNPTSLAFDAAGNLYVGDRGNFVIRKITPAGVVGTLAGTAGSAATTDGAGAAARFTSPRSIAIDAGGTLYVGDQSGIRKVTSAGVVTTFAGAVTTLGYIDGTGTAARFGNVQGLCIDATGTLYVGDAYYHNIRKVTPFGVVSTVAGSTTGSNATTGSTDGPGPTARFNAPYRLTVDGAGVLYVPDFSNSTIRVIR
jgi:hypothetical protein